jgi:hypothetical protein
MMVVGCVYNSNFRQIGHSPSCCHLSVSFDGRILLHLITIMLSNLLTPAQGFVTWPWAGNPFE